MLNGFFQSEKYFEEQAIRELFRIDADTEAYIRTKYRSFPANTCFLIASDDIAWLNPDPAKTVIYPMPWFGYQYRNKLKATDLPPASWTGLSVYPSPLGRQINDWVVRVKYYDRRMFSIIHKKCPNYLLHS